MGLRQIHKDGPQQFEQDMVCGECEAVADLIFLSWLTTTRKTSVTILEDLH